MELLSNIPIALVNNIGFMAILFLMYESMKFVGNFKPSQLFVVAVIIQITSLIQFVLTILAPNYFNLYNFSTRIATITIPFNYSNIQQWLIVIGIIYCTFLIYFITKIAYQFVQLNQLSNSANFSKSDIYKNLLPKNIAHSCTKVKIGLSNKIETPITFGWLHPIILLPIAICNQLSTDEIETILMHEIAHIIRNDYLVNLIVSLNQMVLFFNPFTILLNKELSLQREIACDLIVINIKPRKLVYMNALLKIAEHVHFQSQKKGLNFTLGIFGTKTELLQRVQYFNNINNKSYKQLFLKLFVATSIVGLIFSTLHFSKNLNSNKSKLPSSALSNTKTFVIAAPNQNSFAVSKFKVSNKVVKQKHQIDLSNESYASLVDQTILWIKKHEPETKFATYQEDMDEKSYKVVDKLLINAIFSNYQLKRDLLNKQLAKTNSLKEALDYLLKSDEFEQIKQYEKWTKEFLQTHPVQKDTSLLEEPIIY